MNWGSRVTGREDWDDFRYVLAVADCGSVSGAARRLGVNHATVLRRIAAFEAGAGAEIFDKTAKGYSVAPDRRRIIDAMREVDAAVQAVGRMITGARVPLTGEVRVTTTDTMATRVLPEIVAGLRQTVPGLRIEVVASNSPVDLGRGQADITIRPAATLPPELQGISPAALGFGAYGLRNGRRDRWLGLAGRLSLSVAGQWQSRNVPSDRLGPSADSFLILAELARLGEGIAILPHVIAAQIPDLEPLPDLMPQMSVPIWVACHSDLATVPRISRVRALLADALAQRAAALLGPSTA